MKLVPPTKAYRDANAKRGKWHLLEGEIVSVCKYVFFEEHRIEKDLADLKADDVCKRCWRFGVTE